MRVVLVWKDDKNVSIVVKEEDREDFSKHFKCALENGEKFLWVPSDVGVHYLDIQQARYVTLVLKEPPAPPVEVVKENEEVPASEGGE